MLRALFVCTVFAAATTGQQLNQVSYPQDSTQNNSGHLVPFGVWPGGTYGDGHSQILIPAAFLPGPGAVIPAIEVQCQNNATLNYLILNITVSPTMATSLSTTFASNLIAPQPVLTATNLSVTYNGGWTAIPFQIPYVHDGVSSLVIDVVKSVDPLTVPLATMSTTSNPGRSDLPSMVHSFGAVGSGAWQATTASYSARPLALRFQVAGAPTLFLLSDRFGANNNQFSLGGSISHTVMGVPGGLYLSLMSVTMTPPYSLPPVLGLLYVNGPLLGLGALPANGSFTTTLQIPNNTALAGGTATSPGLHLAFQSLVLDPIAGPQTTNATDCYIYQ